MIFKPRIDDRYDASDVVSHAGIRMRAVPVAGVSELAERARGFEVVGIDEAQFFDEEIVAVALALADDGARVIAAGLDQDFRRLPFGPMPALLAHAEFVDKLQAVCHRCGGGGDDDAAPGRRSARAVLGGDDRRGRERAVRGALPRLPRGRPGRLALAARSRSPPPSVRGPPSRATPAPCAS